MSEQWLLDGRDPEFDGFVDSQMPEIVSLGQAVTINFEDGTEPSINARVVDTEFYVEGPGVVLDVLDDDGHSVGEQRGLTFDAINSDVVSITSVSDNEIC